MGHPLSGALTHEQLFYVLRAVTECSTAETVNHLLSIAGDLNEISASENIIVVLAMHGTPRAGFRRVLFFSARNVDRFETLVRKIHASEGEIDWLFLRDGLEITTVETNIPAFNQDNGYRKCLQTIGYRDYVVSTRTTERLAFQSSLIFAGDRIRDKPHAVPIIEFLAPHFHSTLLRIGLALFRQTETLSDREKEVLCWISAGKTSYQISKILRITERTANFHVQNAMKKVGAVNRTQAIALALQQGLIAHPSIIEAERVLLR